VGLLGFLFFFFWWTGLVVSVFLVFLGFQGAFSSFFCILLGLCPFVYLQYAWGTYAFYKTSLILPIKKQTFNSFEVSFLQL
jgi:hypothetical protein